MMRSCATLALLTLLLHAGGSAHAQPVVAVEWPALAATVEVGGGEGDAAVVAAVERYAFVAPVAGAAQNAVDWFNHLARGRKVPLEHVRLLRDAAVTKEKLLRYLRRAALAVKPGGTLWVVFIGHGAPGRDGKDAVLVGVDAQQDADSLYERSVTRSELLGIAASSKAGRIVVVLDTCFSGRASSGKALIAGLQPLIVTGPPSGLDPRLLLFTAAKGNEFAGPLPGSARPSFSYLLLGALRGWADAREHGGDGNGEVTAKELHGYTQRALSSLLTDRTQTPTFDGAGGAVLGPAREKGPDLAKLVARAPAQSSDGPGGAAGVGENVGNGKRAARAAWSTTPQLGPTIVFSDGVSRTLFGISADLSRHTSELFSWGLYASGGFGSGFMSADVGPQFRWSFAFGEKRDHVPYFRFAVPFRFMAASRLTELGQFEGTFLGVGVPLLGFGYHYFITKNLGVGINFTFIPTLVFSATQKLDGATVEVPYDSFLFTFQLGFGVQASF